MKMKNIWKIIIVIVLILIIIIGAHFIRNYIIVSKIAKKQEIMNNYSLIIENYNLKENNEDNLIIERKYKDGKIVQIFRKSGNEILKDWYDEETKELITIANGVATIRKDKGGPITFNPTMGYDNIQNKIDAIFGAIISKQEFNGEKCYVLNNGIEEYISIETGRRIKQVNVDNVWEYKELNVNTLTDEDVARPNLEGYEIKG